jgi:glycosyltransferase 2 family protein
MHDPTKRNRSERAAIARLVRANFIITRLRCVIKPRGKVRSRFVVLAKKDFFESGVSVRNGFATASGAVLSALTSPKPSDSLASGICQFAHWLMKKGARQWLWIGLSAAVLALIAFHVSRSAEWRHFRWDRFWATLTDANPLYLLGAVVTTYTSYLVRAYRWGFFLEPIKKAPMRILFTGQIVGFSAIYLLGRPGEIVRPGYIANRTGVSYTSMAAVWLLERVFDTTAISLLFSASLYFVPLSASSGEGGPSANPTSGLSGAHLASLIILLLTALFVLFLVYFRLHADRGQLRTPRLLRFLSPLRQQQFEGLLRSFADGLGVIRNFKDLLASLASTALLWAINVTFFWLVFRSVGGDVGKISWMSSALVLFFGALGLLVQIPGIGGGLQVVVIKAMTAFMGIGLEDATGAAILLWVVLMVPCLALGIVMLVHEGLTFKKLEKIAEEERAHLAQ